MQKTTHSQVTRACTSTHTRQEEAPGAGKVLGDDFEYADTILLGFRYAFQVFRFVSIFRRGQQKKAHIVADEIDFDADDATGIELQVW